MRTTAEEPPSFEPPVNEHVYVGFVPSPEAIFPRMYRGFQSAEVIDAMVENHVTAGVEKLGVSFQLTMNTISSPFTGVPVIPTEMLAPAVVWVAELDSRTDGSAI